MIFLTVLSALNGPLPHCHPHSQNAVQKPVSIKIITLLSGVYSLSKGGRSIWHTDKPVM